MLKKVSFVLAMLFTVGLFGDVAMQQWEWKKYNVKFKLPKGYKVTKSEAKAFDLNDGKNFTISIRPWEDAAEDAKGVATKGYGNYGASNKKIVVEQAVTDIKGYEGYIIVAQGDSKGKALWFAVLGLIDPDSSVNLYATMIWWDNESHNEFYADLCDKIAASFEKMN